MCDCKYKDRPTNFSLIFMEFSILLGCKGEVHHLNSMTNCSSTSDGRTETFHTPQCDAVRTTPLLAGDLAKVFPYTP